MHGDMWQVVFPIIPSPTVEYLPRNHACGTQVERLDWLESVDDHFPWEFDMASELVINVWLFTGMVALRMRTHRKAIVPSLTAPCDVHDQENMRMQM